jgi:putative ABC transport system permease protein
MKAPEKFLPRRRLPIAWMMLKRHPLRLCTSLIAFAFASILVLMQLAIQDTLYNSSVALITGLNADAFLLNRQTTGMMSLTSFSQARLANADDGGDVDSTSPFSFRYMNWRLPGEDTGRYPIAIGIDPGKKIFLDEKIQSQLKKLTIDGRVLFDELSPAYYGPVKQTLAAGKEFTVSSGSHRLRVAGIFKLGPTFAYESTIITSLSTFNKVYPTPEPMISIGLIKLKPGISVDEWLKRANKNLPEDVYLESKQDFIKSEKAVWSTEKPIGYIFLFGALMGMTIGAIMVYQLLSSDVSYNILTYATMMSLGYRRSQLEGIVVTEGLIISSIAFPCAWIFSGLLCQLITNSTSLSVVLTGATVLVTYGLAVFVAVSASLFAMLKLRDADPSELFS